MRLITLVSIFVSTFFVSAVHAKKYPACDELKMGDKAACTVKSKTNCDSIEGYWPRRKCIEEVAVEFNECTKGGTFQALCTQRKATYWDVCMKANELDMNKPKSQEEFVRRAQAYPKAVSEAVAFKKEWGACFTHGGVTGPKCSVTSSDAPFCEKAGAQYKKSVKDAVDWFLDTTHKTNLKNMDSLMGNNQISATRGIAEKAIADLAQVQELNAALPTMQHRVKELAQVQSQLAGITKILEAKRQEALSGMRCPKGKNNNKRLVKSMRSSVNQFFGSGKMPKKVKVLRLQGKKTVTHNVFRKETYESYPAAACTKRAKTNTCRVFSISVKRTKVNGKPWGAWVTYVGDSAEMLCKNLK